MDWQDGHAMRLNKAGIAVSAGILLTLAGCSGSSNTTSSRASSSPTMAPTRASAVSGMNAYAKAPAPQIPGARKGGTLTVLSNAGLATLDPTEAYYLDANSILSGLVIRSLTQYVYNPKSQGMVLVPDLATDLGRPNKDFTTWKFTLRPGIEYENGQPVTAGDLKYGIERSFDRTTFPQGANYSNQYFVDGDTYKGPYRSGGYSGVTIKGNTITIKMSQPFPDMPYWGAFAAMSPIPPGKASDPAIYKLHPLATGPYNVSQYTPGQSLTLVKNPYWDPKTDPGRHRYLDEFDFNFVADPARIDQVMLADSGSGQTTISYDSVRADDYQNFRATAGDRLILGATPCTGMWNPDNRKITDVKVRRALGYAYPYWKAWSADGGIPGVTNLPATNVMAPGTAGRVAYNPLPGHVPGTTDPATAREILKASGQMGYPIRFLYATDSGGPVSVAVKNVLVRALAAAGFDPEPVATTSARFWNVQGGANAPINVRRAFWCSDWPSGGNTVRSVFHSTEIATEGFGWNQEAFSSNAADARMDAISSLLLAEQAPAWNALETSIQTTDFPVLVTGYAGVAMMRGSKVHSAFDDSTLGMPTWKDIWLG
jgi:peptide/nickel transport system substrate-binding protein